MFPRMLGKRIANTEKDGDLALWIDAAKRALEPGERRSDAYPPRGPAGGNSPSWRSPISAAIRKFYRSCPKPGAAPRASSLFSARNEIGKKIIERQNAVIVQCKPLILHGNATGYTDEVEAILQTYEILGISLKK